MINETRCFLAGHGLGHKIGIHTRTYLYVSKFKWYCPMHITHYYKCSSCIYRVLYWRHMRGWHGWHQRTCCNHRLAAVAADAFVSLTSINCRHFLRDFNINCFHCAVNSTIGSLTCTQVIIHTPVHSTAARNVNQERDKRNVVGNSIQSKKSNRFLIKS